MTDRYELRFYGAARRSLEARLPLSVALAIWEFCDGPLRERPQQVGGLLGRELAGYRAARRGAYRIVYRVDDDARVVHVVRIEHRADVCRPR